MLIVARAGGKIPRGSSRCEPAPSERARFTPSPERAVPARRDREAGLSWNPPRESGDDHGVRVADRGRELGRDARGRPRRAADRNVGASTIHPEPRASSPRATRPRGGGLWWNTPRESGDDHRVRDADRGRELGGNARTRQVAPRTREVGASTASPRAPSEQYPRDGTARRGSGGTRHARAVTIMVT